MSVNVEGTGLLVDGRRVAIDGLTILGPGDAPWIRLEARDYRARQPGIQIRQLMLHSTWGGWPHVVVNGTGPRGGAKNTAMYWHSSKDGKEQSGAAALVVDEDRSIVCLCDIVRDAPHHATTSNPWSVGIEMYQRPNGRIYSGVLDATTMLCVALATGKGARYVDTGEPWCGLGIPLQIPGHVYRNAPIERMRAAGGPDMVGVFGHRDVAWRFPWQLTEGQRQRFPNGYADRGRGDPGDEIGRRLELAGAERFDFDKREDIAYWKQRQARLNELGETLAVDGIAGRKTITAMRRHGFASGRELV